MKSAAPKNSISRKSGLISATNSILSSIVCIIIGLLVGFIILVCINAEHAGEGFMTILIGGFNNINAHARNISKEIAEAAPLIMTGLSVAFAYKTGLFNIGAAGQYSVGALGALYFALVLHMPWYICILAAMLCGAVWGAIPGLLKAFFNVNEVITSIMFNWIALYGVNELLKNNVLGKMYESTKNKTYVVRTTSAGSAIPNMGLDNIFSKSTTIAIFIAIIVAIIMYIIINKTTFGYELKACGHNKDAAKYAGINEKRSIILSMVIAGALAGLGAALFYLSGVGEWNPNDSTACPAIGFNGISVALLAVCNPIGCVFSALLISHITVGGSCLATAYYQPEIADIIIGVIIYLCAFAMLFKMLIGKVVKVKSTSDANADPQIELHEPDSDKEAEKEDEE
ncbi:MAG: ABC transporter permease [Clostridiales bacterium]|nr:ABC transporter permease [Clostridiales bacterium]